MLFGENWNNCDIDLKIRSIITVVALPGGWCDVDQSVASNTEKEVLEDAGIAVRAERLLPCRIGAGIIGSTVFTA